MSNGMKITKLVLEKIKNVDKGTIDFTYKKDPMNMIGIYGQNGSGKTTVIQVIALIKQLLMGTSIKELNAQDLINSEDFSYIEISFEIEKLGILKYKVKLENNKEISLKEEDLLFKKFGKGNRFNRIICAKTNEETIELSPQQRFSMNKENIKKFYFAKAHSESKKTSFIFSRVIKDYLTHNLKGNLLKAYTYVSEKLPFNIFIYTNMYYGLINADLTMPFLFHYREKNHSVQGTIPMNLNKASSISEEHYKVIKNIIKQINYVLPAIIPTIKIELRNLGPVLSDKGDTLQKVEFISSRDGKTFPMRCESEGIKKIISILSALINVYGNKECMVFIDELDSGIFEYLLGELIEILDKNIKGQIIFTSHNLRPLELLKNYEVYFTTTDSYDRYIRFGSIKKSNNLRSMYLRNVQVGGLEKKLYNETDTYKIDKSFRDAVKIDENE
ncbi:ATP-binding protein [Limosilactobacillus reuteri]|uniref:ATP-binding protein n=1 Tax=Limosilactobacillus reuteri TaxID=1598 RepID=UPI001E5E001A|nr:ATP-binding protein [Limosilactobacillus reuteri]MCC4408752.1 ATP-binding protein [Limosilactobacillus reuteri]